MEPFPLEIVFTAAGAIVGAGLIASIVELAKRFGVIAEHGRAPMISSAVLAAALVGLAAWSAGLAFTPESILLGVLAWMNVSTAAIGSHATVRKAHSIATHSTNPAGPDPEG